jgi:hypothetical protein
VGGKFFVGAVEVADFGVYILTVLGGDADFPPLLDAFEGLDDVFEAEEFDGDLLVALPFFGVDVFPPELPAGFVFVLAGFGSRAGFGVFSRGGLGLGAARGTLGAGADLGTDTRGMETAGCELRDLVCARLTAGTATQAASRAR